MQLLYNWPLGSQPDSAVISTKEQQLLDDSGLNNQPVDSVL